MAVRRPLYWNGTEVIEMTDTQIDNLVQRVCFAYAANPSVDLNYVASAGSLASIGPDTRYQAGAMSQSSTAFVSEALTADISLVTGTTYDCIDETVAASVAYPQLANPAALPVYWDTTEGIIKSMSSQDFLDTFIDPAIDYLVSGNTQASTVLKQGTYFISTASSVTNATLISTNPIFVDTTANAGAYTSGGIPEALDQPTI